MNDTKHEAQGLEVVGGMYIDARGDRVIGHITDPEKAKASGVDELIRLSDATAVIDQLRERVAELERQLIEFEWFKLNNELLAAELAAAPKAEQPPEQEPVAWMLADAVGGSMMEFQRELLLEFQCRYGGEIVPLYTAPQPVSDDAKDAARYRWLLNNAGLSHWENMLRFADIEHLDDISKCIDAAMGSKGE